MSVFSVFDGKNTEKSVNGEIYYRRLGRVSAAAKYLCLLLCLLVLLYGFSFRTDEINKDNFSYLLNYIGEGEADPEEYGTVYFDSNEKNRYAIVRGDLAVVNDGGSAVYALSGDRRSVDPTLKPDSPQLLSSARYMYIYDLGGTDLVIKSPLETVHTLKYNYPIRGAAVTESGCLAVICEEKTSRSSVYVYDDSFRMIYDCSYGSLYTLSADLNKAADRLLTASVDAEAGEFTVKLCLYALNSKDALSEKLIKGEYPYKAAFCEGGGFMLLTDKACRFYGEDAELVSTLEFGANGISAYNMGDRYFIRQYPLSALSSAVRLEIYKASDGSPVWKRDFPAGVKLAKSCGVNVFLVSGGKAEVLLPESGVSRGFEVGDDTTDILQIDEKKLLLLSKGSASVFEYGALFEKEESSWTQ